MQRCSRYRLVGTVLNTSTRAEWNPTSALKRSLDIRVKVPFNLVILEVVELYFPEKKKNK